MASSRRTEGNGKPSLALRASSPVEHSKERSWEGAMARDREPFRVSLVRRLPDIEKKRRRSVIARDGSDYRNRRAGTTTAPEPFARHARTEIKETDEL